MADEGNQLAETRARVMQRLGERQEPIPTPWPELTELAELNYRHKVGIIAQRGSREAKVGRDTAVHAARAGIPTVLYTGYPPDTQSEWLAVDETPNPTAALVNAKAEDLVNGQKPRLIIIERYERLSPEPQPAANLDDPADEPIDDPEPLASWADQLIWSVRDIRIDIPLLLTTVVTPEPDMSRRMSEWLHIDHPAMVMTDVCKPTLLVRRTGPEAVEARIEVDPHEYRTGERSELRWAPLNLQAYNSN
ncbi:hypothetical protein [Streptomyces sp. NBC_00842]|uniref:hypothetical protein n=1 Tax=Streptomyces sp. NBC_00842 TaxID=2975848 RepID=UPI00386B22FA|nr:hypothetical protein OH821_01990 [Streptomyces sp. NBC_00842]